MIRLSLFNAFSLTRAFSDGVTSIRGTKMRPVKAPRPNLKPLRNPEVAMKFLGIIGALAIIIAVAAAVFFFGGFYNVAATQPDLGIVAWALERVRDASINRHAVDQPPASMDDPVMI